MITAADTTGNPPRNTEKTIYIDSGKVQLFFSLNNAFFLETNDFQENVWLDKDLRFVRCIRGLCRVKALIASTDWKIRH